MSAGGKIDASGRVRSSSAADEVSEPLEQPVAINPSNTSRAKSRRNTLRIYLLMVDPLRRSSP